MAGPLRLRVRRTEQPPRDALDRRIEISLRVPTDLAVVEEAVDLVARHCLAAGVPPQAARFKLRVALSEALANAIVYGNRMDPNKQVDVRVLVTADALSVHVCDEGEGFDYDHLPDPTLSENITRPHGRGLFLIQHYSDAVKWKEGGNHITISFRKHPVRDGQIQKMGKIDSW